MEARSPASASPLSSSSRDPRNVKLSCPSHSRKAVELGQQVAGDAVRRHLQLPHRRRESPEQRLPVGNDDAHLLEHGGERVGEIARLRLRQRLDVDGDVAFLMPFAHLVVADARDVLQAAGFVAPGLEDRVQEQAHADAAGLQLAQHRVDEEGHVVVDDLDQRAVRQPAIAATGHAADADLVPPFRLGGDERERLAGVAGEPVGRQLLQAVEALAAIEQRRERGSRRGLAQHLLHLPDQAVSASIRLHRHGAVLLWRATRSVNPRAGIDNRDDRPLTMQPLRPPLGLDAADTRSVA